MHKALFPLMFKAFHLYTFFMAFNQKKKGFLLSVLLQNK